MTRQGRNGASWLGVARWGLAWLRQAGLGRKGETWLALVVRGEHGLCMAGRACPS